MAGMICDRALEAGLVISMVRAFSTVRVDSMARVRVRVDSMARVRVQFTVRFVVRSRSWWHSWAYIGAGAPRHAAWVD